MQTAHDYLQVDFGDVRVTAIHDGRLASNANDYRNIEPEKLAQRLSAAGVWPPVTDLNVFLIETGSARILVDTGAGDRLDDTAGRTHSILSALGTGLADITHVFLTHMHSDHIAGLVSLQGDVRFDRALVLVSRTELDFWSSPKFQEPQFQEKSAFAREMLALYRDRIVPIEAGELWPSISAVSLPGHTPGHCGLQVTGPDRSLLIVGDLLHLPEIQVEWPDVTTAYDVDEDLAAATRKRVLAEMAGQDTLLAGMHFRWPPFVTVEEAAACFVLRHI